MSSSFRSSHYDVLQLRSDASADEIRSAWRRLAQQFHPDRAEGPVDGEAITRINRAYEVLSNPHARAQHDFELRARQGRPLARPLGRRQRMARLWAWGAGTAAAVALAGVSWAMFQLWSAPAPQPVAAARPAPVLDISHEAPLRLVPAQRLERLPRPTPTGAP